MTDINTDTIKNMINLAIEQIKYSYAPYSDFKVGEELCTLFRVYSGSRSAVRGWQRIFGM